MFTATFAITLLALSVGWFATKTSDADEQALRRRVEEATRREIERQQRRAASDPK